MITSAFALLRSSSEAPAITVKSGANPKCSRMRVAIDSGFEVAIASGASVAQRDQRLPHAGVRLGLERADRPVPRAVALEHALRVRPGQPGDVAEPVEDRRPDELHQPRRRRHREPELLERDRRGCG